ncbi:lysylphosphatidylglycerol synthase transmembrane domain-containing protein [Dyadobacter fanqingshengii]|uniref:Flippase-like domain-containing protein n=1 Tax=Dyadobacter fanqingshengii TaxID=2906443 RepID=A0A9X1PB16_9BACT|nr:lysylphosphatidylglycerol synthase transmembrane domain-containing protein [Dyadobacter fanqingshengii]MCF0041681.1 flippase-like domain-containing protein [Dyadobacter fanqingshengii]USJ36605.1 flippase-like domain-containing protein [Dyadobacter fanqingshengii]
MVQDKELSTAKEKRNLQNLLWIGKLIITLLILSYIYKTFRNEQKGIGDVGAVFHDILVSEHFPILFSMLMLVPVNWALESLKWQQLAKKVVDINFRDAFRGTLTGLAFGVAAPAQLGDTFGRVAALKSDRRLEAIGAAIVSNGIQFYISVVAGAVGWLHLQEKIGLTLQSKQIINMLLVAVIISGIVVVWFRKPLTDWRPKRLVFQKAHAYLRIIGNYSAWDLVVSTLYGSLRYAVFLSQFVLALSLFDFPIPSLELASAVSLIFLAKTLIPAINVLGDLGLREFTALLVFKQYNLPAEEIIAATFLVWILNVLGPILIGIFLIWKYKWSKMKFSNSNN